ncbi:MAG TPA: hypothetical protein DCE27_03770 [Xanthomarina gelatinilytica]|nr:hypothetical protein [Xanthomarina gelatinilytica]|tara:strand:+ start:740 stop:1483 length:744 start_codon:yes stop_codon:yes gene_type:complete
MIKELKGKNIAIVAMGKSQLDYHMSISHSKEYDEVWAINSMCAVIKCDRVFMMDPASRFFDTFDAGPQTQVMRRTLPKLEIPVYSCELDSRVPAIELFPLDELVEKMGCGYLNNTIAYAIAFAAFNEVGKVSMYGADFSYSTNIHFGELGRGCCEFWLAKCMSKGIDVSIAATSPMLDTNVSEKEKLYGYHRLEDPPVVYLKDGDLKTTNFSNIEENNEKLVGVSGRQDPIRVSKTNGLTPPEPNQY